MNENILKELSNAIVKVIDLNDEEISYKHVEIKPHLFKYSSTHKEKPTLFIDNVPYSSKNKFKIVYKCSCGNINKILLEKYVLKKKLSCIKCSQTEDLKKWHGEVLKKIHQGVGYISKNNTCTKRIYDFEKEDEDFKKEFYKNNLTFEEFETVIKYLHSVNNVEIENKEVKFLEHENGVNGKKYRQMVSIDNNVIPFKKIKLKCPLCGKVFSITRPIKERVISHNFDCKGCYLNNKIFPVRKYKNNLTYQGNLELDFIRRCEKGNIEIVNGAEVEYVFNKKHLKYKIDFFLPKYNFQIEIKDNHIWHREQVKSGKWEEKENAAKEYCLKHNMKYFLLFPNEIDNFFKNLERDSLNNYESS